MAELWQAAAILPLAQKEHFQVFGGGEVGELMIAAGLADKPAWFLAAEEVVAALGKRENLPYHVMLRMASGLGNCNAPDSALFQDIPSTDGDYIVVCPYGHIPSLELPDKVWRLIVALLRTYGLKLHFLAEKGRRMDFCPMPESEVAAEFSMADKLVLLAGAKLVVGVPGTWLWLATAWEKKSIVLYPESEPKDRWYHWTGPNYARIVFDTTPVRWPMFLMAIRQLVAAL